MKTKEELNALKEEVETVSRKLNELTKEDLEQVCGGDESCPLDMKGDLELILKKRKLQIQVIYNQFPNT